MCLTYDKKADAPIRRKLRARKRPILAWKLVDMEALNLYSLYRNHMWKVGINESTRRGGTVPGKDANDGWPDNSLIDVNRGFHGFRKKPVSEIWTILRVWISPKDVVAATDSEIVATKVRVTQKDYDAAIAAAGETPCA